MKRYEIRITRDVRTNGEETVVLYRPSTQIADSKMLTEIEHLIVLLERDRDRLMKFIAAKGT